ncbi:MAG: LPS assembly lipoprotein LptE [Pseudaminobacter sp.]
MSLPDQTRKPAAATYGALFLSLSLSLAVLSACTVRPLYSDAGMAAGAPAGARAGLSSIAIKPVATRYGQEVRNHLIFGLNGGAGQPANPLYSLTLDVTARASAAATIQRALEEEPTASMMTVAATYVLTDAKTGKVVAQGRREASSSYDVPRQSFAALRAQRDAENRAARELAELLRLAIGQDLSKGR